MTSISRYKGLSFMAVLSARCPSCRKGRVTRHFFWINRRCEVCAYDFYPESGFYLGAMLVGYLVTAVLMIPLIIGLKFSGMEIRWVLGTPILIFLLIGPIVTYYARILWLHVEYRMTRHLDG